ncbi:MAG TPA: 5'/3'-nucleotidase SurE [Candidatus Acidoferrales bacterium]|nr:5'/3'-nucleotidase SurE [Candidatus Acidoferrales bacterium]
MRILVTNDDGVESDGLIVLADALSAVGEVTVVAPDGDRSGVSHSITIRHTVTVSPVGGRKVPTYTCSGTPADCVVLGAFELCGGLPDVVVSGINRGANLGDDTNYSGTVAGAMEGIMVGSQAIAISLASTWPKVDDVHRWETAASIACALAADLVRKPLPAPMLLNVNVPNVDRADLLGTRYTSQGRKRYEDRVAREAQDGTIGYYWIWGTFDKSQIGEGTDLEALEQGYASVTPMSADRTHYPTLERLRNSVRA